LQMVVDFVVLYVLLKLVLPCDLVHVLFVVATKNDHEKPSLGAWKSMTNRPFCRTYYCLVSGFCLLKETSV
jgi:hypothetical protein